MATPFEYLKEDALEHGADLRRWPKARRLAAVVETYKRDQRFFMDALDSVREDTIARDLLAGLDCWNDDPMQGAKTISVAVVVALREWPLDWLSERCNDWLPLWKADADRDAWIEELNSRAGIGLQQRVSA